MLVKIKNLEQNLIEFRENYQKGQSNDSDQVDLRKALSKLESLNELLKTEISKEKKAKKLIADELERLQVSEEKKSVEDLPETKHSNIENVSSLGPFEKFLTVQNINEKKWECSCVNNMENRGIFFKKNCLN